MYKILYAFLILLGYSQAFTQTNNEDESNDFSHAISIGWSNPISSISTLFNSKNEEKFGVLIDYQMDISENNIYRVHSKFSPSYENPMLSLNNFLIIHNINTNNIVVEINGSIITKSLWGQYVLKENDKIEIVTAVGGG